MDGLELRVFRGDTIAQALGLVRQELGPDAIILQTRQLTRQTFTGPKTYSVEITAAADPSELAERLPRSGEAPAATPTIEVVTKEIAEPEPPRLDPIQMQIDALAQMVRELYAKREDIWKEEVPVAPLERGPDALEKHLRRAELPEELIGECIAAAQRLGVASLEPSEPVVVDTLVDFLSQRIPVAARRRGEREVLSFVGPPGCGKTTTLAKLASIATAEEARRVAIVTMDTYRVGAAEQLRAYASILDVPFEVVYTPTQLDDALRRQAQADTILIDTAGRCALDEKRMGQLELFLRGRAEVYLVLGMDLRESVLMRFLRLCSSIEHHGVILTKLDAIARHGSLAGVCAQLSAPVSYLATGPDVPGDLVRGDKELIARLALGYSRLEPASSMRMAAA